MAVAILESVESVVLLEHTYDLELAFKDNYGPIVEELNKAGLLKFDVYDAMKDPKLGSRVKASLIVTSIKEYVKIQPKNYHKFLNILERTERYFYDIVKKLKETYCKKTGTSEQEADIGSSPKSTANEDQFPFLQLEEGSNREDLMTRLELESKEMTRKFAVLVSQTEKVLHNRSATVQSLILLIKNLRPSFEGDGNKLMRKLNKLKDTDITRALCIMSDYWSFFDYELLSSIIEGQDSPEVRSKLDEYVVQFTQFCERRLCEVPIDVLSAKEERKIHPKDVCIKLDVVFTIPLKLIKAVIKKLSAILDTSLRLVGVEKGCVELAYMCMHELDKIFPLSDEQNKMLSQIQVMKIYSNSEVYYERVKSVQILTDGNVSHKPELLKDLPLERVAESMDDNYLDILNRGVNREEVIDPNFDPCTGTSPGQATNFIMTSLTEANRAVDTLVQTIYRRFIACNISEIIKGGSLGHGTPVFSKYDVDLVVYSCDIKADDLRQDGYGPWLEKMKEFLYQNFPDTKPKIEDCSVRFTFKGIDVDLLISPYWEDQHQLYKYLQSIPAHERQLFKSGASKWQVQFFKMQPPQVKEYIRKAKQWRNENWSEGNRNSRMPSSYLISLLVVAAYEQNPRDVTQAIEDLVKQQHLDLCWEIFYKKSEYPLPSRPRVVDPANPFNNVWCSGTGLESYIDTINL